MRKQPKEKPQKPQKVKKEKPVKEKTLKGSPHKLAKKFEHDLPEVAKRLGVRVSSPYGYYPEDVDAIILRLEKDVSDLEKENKKLSEELDNYKNRASMLQTELSQIKMQVSLMEIPDASTEESFAMLSRVGTITGKNENTPVNEVSNVPHTELNAIESKHSSNQPTTYSNLIKPKIKLSGGN